LRSSRTKHLREILRYRTAEIIKTAPRLEASVRRIVSHLRKVRKDNKQ